MTPAVPIAPPVAVSKRNDFADWLSPILVKELRQGLQSRLFVSAFVLLQAAMVLFVGLGLISVSGDRNTAAFMFEGFFQVCVWVPLLIFMPARGLGAIGEETRAQTLDLVQLTRLSAFRIVWGKWLALVAQTCLLASAILPYAVLRYYFGQVDVVGELVWFATLLVASMVLTAASVSMSAAHVAVRILVLMMILPSVVTSSGIFFALRGLGGVGLGSPSFGGIGETALWILPAAALYIYFFLELAASKIAPQAENHSARKRILVLLLVGIVAVSGWCCSKDAFVGFVGLFAPIVIFVVLESLCEMPVLMPNIYRPFALRGFLGRMVGHFLYPGWVTGVLFTGVVIALTWCGFSGSYGRTLTDNDELRAFAMEGPMAFLALVSPLPILRLFPRLKRRFWPYLLVQALCVLMFTIAAIIADSPGGSRSGSFNLLAPIPTSALLALVSHPDNKSLMGCIIDYGGAADVLLLAWLGMGMFREFRIVKKLEDLSLGKNSEAPEVVD